MKKVILILSAVAAIAACTKNEVIPVSSNENAEITFNVAPKTKADADKTQTFDTNNVFASWAFYLPSGKTWSANVAESQPYIVNSTVSYLANENVWKNSEKSYYWPKAGSLTFFAYSLNKTDLSLNNPGYPKNKVDCYNAANCYGISALLDLSENPNTDLLVADIAADKKANATTYYYSGVPTLFKHKMSRVAFAVRKAADYSDKKFTLNYIKFHNLNFDGHYAQFSNEGQTDKTVCAEYIKPGDTRKDIDYTTTVMEVTSSNDYVNVANEENYIYFPQLFEGVEGESKVATIEINYTVTTTVTGGANTTTIDETLTKKLNVKDFFASWDMGKRYTFNLTFSLDEIFWDPAVEDWTDVQSREIIIK